MAFTVQDDTGTEANANAYISVLELKDYWADRGDILLDSDAVLQAMIVEATQYIDFRYRYKGTKLEGRDQTTQFPRYLLYDLNDDLVEGIPREVKEACAEYALASQTIDLTGTSTTGSGTIIEESSKVGPIEKSVKYKDTRQNSFATYAVVQVADNLLLNSGFVLNIGGPIPIRG